MPRVGKQPITAIPGWKALGEAAEFDTTAFASAEQGTKADSASQPGHTHDADDVSSGLFDPSRIGSGTPSEKTFLRGDSTWAALTGVGTSSAAGRWSTGGLLGSGNMATSNAWGAGYALAHLVYIPVERTIEAFGCFVPTATTSGTLRFGLYAIGTDYLPGDLVVTHEGVIDSSSIGAKEIAVPATAVAGMYYAVAQTGNVAGGVTRSIGPYFSLGHNLTEGTIPALIYTARADDTLPTSLAGSSWTYTTGGSQVPHGIWMRFSA